MTDVQREDFYCLYYLKELRKWIFKTCVIMLTMYTAEIMILVL